MSDFLIVTVMVQQIVQIQSCVEMVHSILIEQMEYREMQMMRNVMMETYEMEMGVIAHVMKSLVVTG